MIVIKEEPFSHFEPEARGLMALQAIEAPMIHPHRIDWGAYRALANAGVLRVISVRDNGVLVGYSLVFVQENFSCVGEKIACCPTMWLHPQYRGGTNAGLRLFNATEELAKAERVETVVFSSPTRYPVDVILKRRGYKPQETMFGRRL